MTWPRKLAAFALVLAAAAVGTVVTSADDRAPEARQPREAKPVKTDGFRFLAFDGFDGQFGLNWQVVRPDPSHASLSKNPGRLTVTTQQGSIAGQRGAAAVVDGKVWWVLADGSVRGPGDPHLTKNLYLIDNPLAKDADFTATTCVVGFDPRSPYQQAGLILYTDDDHYLKWTYEFNDEGKGAARTAGGLGSMLLWDAVTVTGGEVRAGAALAVLSPKPTVGRPCFISVGEVGGEATRHVTAEAEPKLGRVWLRVVKRGNLYDCLTSTDGERFVKRGTADWGKGGPKRIGLIAQNGGEAGGVSGVPATDAQFEFFELRAER